MTSPIEPNAAAALLAANRRRRSIRRWILLGTLPLTLAGLILSGKLLSMYAFAHQSISSYVAAGYAESEAAARGLEWLNWFQPFIAPYDIGTALGGADELAEARDQLTTALPLAQGLEVCAVRINLSLVTERMGDAAQAEGDAAEAAERYGEALQITVDTPEECNSEEAQDQSPDPTRDMSQTLEENRQRQQEKQQQLQQPDQQQPQQPDQQQPETPEPSQSDLDDIEQKLNQGQQEREDELGGQDDQGGFGSGTDRPW